MTDPQRIRALITRLESEGGSREASDEYLVLCCGWKRIEDDDGELHFQADDGEPFSDLLMHPGSGRRLADRDDPTTNAQDALDSLPDDKWQFHSWSNTGTDLERICEARLDGHGLFTGIAKTAAAAICLARLNMELAKLEGG